jgi:hypothetical protein
MIMQAEEKKYYTTGEYLNFEVNVDKNWIYQELLRIGHFPFDN